MSLGLERPFLFCDFFSLSYDIIFWQTTLKRVFTSVILWRYSELFFLLLDQQNSLLAKRLSKKLRKRRWKWLKCNQTICFILYYNIMKKKHVIIWGLSVFLLGCIVGYGLATIVLRSDWESFDIKFETQSNKSDPLATCTETNCQGVSCKAWQFCQKIRTQGGVIDCSCVEKSER